MTRPLLLLTAFSLLASAGLCHADPLTDQKEAAKKKFLKENADSLAPAKIEEYKLVPEDPGAGAVTITIGQAEIRLPAPAKREDGKAAIALTYPEFVVIIENRVLHYDAEYASLPAAWGKTDLEKSFHICTASGKTIDDAKTAEELEDAVVLVTARNTIAPMGADRRAVLVTAPGYKGLLAGSMVKRANGRSSCMMNIQPDPPDGSVYKIIFSRKDGETTDEAVKAFLPKISVTMKKAE